MAELVIRLKGKELRRMPIDRQRMRIGRDAHNEVVIDNIGVSRHHASILFQEREFLVVDEGSQNGLFVNGNKQDTWPLRHGDTIQIGKFEVVFDDTGGPTPQDLKPDLQAPHSVKNPMKTTAMSADDVRRYMNQTLAERARERMENPAPAAAAAPSQGASDQVAFYRNLAVGLGIALVVLVGAVVAYFLS